MEPLPSAYQEQRTIAPNQQHSTRLITTPDHAPKSLDNPGVNMQMELITHTQQGHVSSPPHHPQINNNILQPKQLVVSSNIGPNGQNYHSAAVTTNHQRPEQFPDLLNMQNTLKTSPLMQLSRKSNQPLNPAALVLPPSPPLQFPHQFPHLIHPTGRSNITPHNSPANPNQPKRGPPPPPPTRSHSFENSFNESPQESQVAPLLSPPAQFSHSSFVEESSSKQQQLSAIHKGYVTLPRKLQHNNASVTSSEYISTTSFTDNKRGLVDWSAMTDRAPIYDGVGPRTSATGSCHNVNTSEDGDDIAKNLTVTPNNISTTKHDLKAGI